ncbi:CobW family GTP-binding protein [Bacillus songklensis]|uniref:CobW family GTP-binding protein n=1 Tax=Bacillus songklensis TaxID=1069116 RepID=A0ABV8B7H8_9BACI
MKKIPVYVVSGFLGSGKTTVLLKMIEQCKRENKKVAVILNELGAVNVETHLFHNQQVIELLNGCICCTIQDDLRQTLEGLIVQHEREPIDVLLIEGTGVAHPLEIVEVFAHSTMEKVFHVESVIGVVDVSHFLEYLSVFSSSKEIRTLLKEQVMYSSFILLNKVDCVDHKLLQKIHKKIDSLKNSETPVVTTTYGHIDDKELWKRRMDIIHLHQTDHHSDHDHHHSHHGTIQTVKLEHVPIVDKQALTSWLCNLPNEVIRAKGLIRLTGELHLTHVQYADKRVRFTTVEQNHDEKSMFVFIGKDLNGEMFQALQKGFIL